MDSKELEDIITRAIVSYLVDRVMERLAARNLVPSSSGSEQVGQAALQGSHGDGSRFVRMNKRLVSREDAVQCREGQTLVVCGDTIVSPLAEDELARRNVLLIRE